MGDAETPPHESDVIHQVGVEPELGPPLMSRRISVFRGVVAGLSVLTGAAFVLSSLYLLYYGSWTTIVFDQWRIYDGYLASSFPANVLGLQNGHRPVFPGLLYLADLYFFGASNYFINTAGVLFAIVTAFLLSLFVGRSRGFHVATKAILISWTWIFFFWLANARILGHGNGSLSVYLPTLSVVAAAWLLVKARDAHEAKDLKQRNRSLGWAAACCFVATFSFGPGMLAWIALLVAVVAMRLPIRTFIVPLVLLLAGSIVLYLFVLPGHDRVQRALDFDLLRIIRDALTWLGAPSFYIADGIGITADTFFIGVLCPIFGGIAVLMSILLVGECLFSARRKSAVEIACLVVIVFCIGVGGLVALSRGSLFESFPNQRVAPRYLPWACLFWNALIIWCAHAVARLPRPRAGLVFTGLTASLAVPLLMLPAHDAHGRTHEVSRNKMRQAAMSLVVGVHDDTQVSNRLFQDQAAVYRVADDLKRRGVAMFSWSVAAHIGKPINEQFAVVENQRQRGKVQAVAPIEGSDPAAARFSGWMQDTDTLASARFIVAVSGDGLIKGLAEIVNHLAFSRFREDRDKPRSFSGYIADYREGESFTYYVIDADESTARVIAH